MFVPTPDPAMNTSSIVHSVRLVSNTKDSLFVEWDVHSRFRASLQAFDLRYTAMGSIVSQVHHLAPQQMKYEIINLHENTNYEVCVEVFTNLTSADKGPHPVRECIKASTKTDSLSVALGSTFGAFLALGIIVFFVFLAKWQHQKKIKKQLQLQQLNAQGGEYDSMVQAQEADLEMSDISLQVHEDTTARLEFSSQSSSQISATANGTARHANHIEDRVRSNRSSAGSTSRAEGPSPAVPSTSSAADGSIDSTTVLLVHEPPPVAFSGGSGNTEAEPAEKVRPPDVRPKTRPPVTETNNPHKLKQLPDDAATPIRPNMSCNW